MRSCSHLANYSHLEDPARVDGVQLERRGVGVRACHQMVQGAGYRVQGDVALASAPAFMRSDTSYGSPDGSLRVQGTGCRVQGAVYGSKRDSLRVQSMHACTQMTTRAHACVRELDLLTFATPK